MWRSVARGVIVLIMGIALAACGPDLALDSGQGLYLNALVMTGPGTGYAVGVELAHSRGVLVRATNGAWSLDPAQPPVTAGDTLKALAVVGTTLWVAGSNTDSAHGNASQVTGVIMQRDSTGAWHRVKFGVAINGLAFAGPDDGWAVGDGGLILHWHANAWSPVPDAMSDTLLAVAFRSPTDGWAVGALGALVHYDGTRWVHAPHLTHETLTSLALTADDGWAAGTNGVLFRLHGDQWAGFAAPITVNNSAVAFAQGNLWVAGEHGSVAHYTPDGQWLQLPQPADEQLNALAIDPVGTLWVVGNSAQPNLYALSSGAAWRTIPVVLGT